MTRARCPGVRLAALLGALAALAGAPGRAEACFFYEEPADQTVVDQTAMQVFLRQSGGTTTAVFGTRTQGYVPDLGWIIAVPRHPTVAVAPAGLFTSLDFATAPVFRTSSGGDGSAYAASSSAGCGGADTARAGAPPDETDDHSEVTIWDSTVVGPYSVDVLTADSVLALREWVESNGFPWRPETEPDFEHYLGLNYFFVAAKVTPSPDSAALVPLALTYEDDELVVPLILSRREATTDMGLLVWIVADSPAVPTNWAQVAVPLESVVIDQSLGTSNYGDLVAETVEAGGAGQAFVTEYVQDIGVTLSVLTDAPTREFIGTEGVVTRLYTRVDPEDVTTDPVFALDPAAPRVAQLHDLTLVENGPYWGAVVQPVWGAAPFALLLLRRLRRRGTSPRPTTTRRGTSPRPTTTRRGTSPRPTTAGR